MSIMLRRDGGHSTRSGSHRFRPTLHSLETREMLSAVVSPATSADAPTADEQYMLQLVNRARANPSAEAQRLLAIAQSDPTIQAALSGWDASAFLQEMNSHGSSPPLAFNPRLIAASMAQNSAMLAANAQIHSVPGSLARPTNSSQYAPDGQPYYPSNDSSWATAENVFAYSGNLSNPQGQTLDNYFHEAFLLDWGNPDFGHLRNLLLPGPSGAAAAGTYPMSEIGIGILTNVQPTTQPTNHPEIAANLGLNVGPALISEEFGWRSGHEFLTGAVYNDQNGDSFYEPGEGLGGVTISAVGLRGEGTFSTQTWSSGGYSLDLPAGSYSVTASGGGLTSPRTTTITIGADNIGWDVAVSHASTPAPTNPTPRQNPGTQSVIAPQATPSPATQIQSTSHTKHVVHQPHLKAWNWHRPHQAVVKAQSRHH